MLFDASLLGASQSFARISMVISVRRLCYVPNVKLRPATVTHLERLSMQCGNFRATLP